MPWRVDEWVTLTPVQLAVLLDLPREDSVYLSTAPVRLPAKWHDTWCERLGPRELTLSEVVLVSGLSAQRMRNGLAPNGYPRLRHRVTGLGARLRQRIAPAAVVQFIRELNRLNHHIPAFTETPAQVSRKGQRSQAILAAVLDCDWELAERLRTPPPSRSERKNITLYHATHRKCCAAIAASGFIPQPNGYYGHGVYLLPFVGILPKPGSNHLHSNDDIDPLEAEQVAFEFRMPRAEVEPFARGGYEYRPPDHPEFDPERDTPDPYFPDRMPPDTWVVPSELANRFCTGLKHWSGKNPLTDEQLRAIDARRDKPKRRTRNK